MQTSYGALPLRRGLARLLGAYSRVGIGTRVSVQDRSVVYTRQSICGRAEATAAATAAEWASGGPHMGGRVDTVVVSGCVDGGEARRALRPDGEFDGDIRVCVAFSSCR